LAHKEVYDEEFQRYWDDKLGSFKAALYAAIVTADLANRFKLYKVFPDEVNAVNRYDGNKEFVGV
jgi:hypothetical protein